MGILNATATYGRGFVPSPSPGIYSIRVYIGGFAGPKTADARATQEIKAFQSAQGYRSHRIVYRRYCFVPSCFDYVVQFGHE